MRFNDVKYSPSPCPVTLAVAFPYELGCTPGLSIPVPAFTPAPTESVSHCPGYAAAQGMDVAIENEFGKGRRPANREGSSPQLNQPVLASIQKDRAVLEQVSADSGLGASNELAPVCQDLSRCRFVKAGSRT